MNRQTRRVEGEAKQKFLLDEIESVKRSASGDHWIVKVFKWYIGGTQTHPESGVDRTKTHTYRATFDGCSVQFIEEPSS